MAPALKGQNSQGRIADKLPTAYRLPRFQKYLVAFYNEEEKETLEAVRKELHSSFALLSAEDQKYAGIFLVNVKNGLLKYRQIS